MTERKKKTTLLDVINNLFTNFHRLLFTNLLFAAPFAFFFAIFWSVSYFAGINSNMFLLLFIIPLFPFYAGVVQVTAHIANGEEGVEVFSNFVSAVKENFLRFLIHGVAFYLAVIFSVYSILIYVANLSKNPALFLFMVVSIIVSVLMLFMFFYIPSMTVTFDISMKDIYKNSFLMSFGELKHNLFAVFGLFLFFVLCTTILLCCVVKTAVIIATVVLSLFLIPSVTAFIINSAVYKRMYIMIVDGSSRSAAIDEKMDEQRRKLEESRNKKTAGEQFDESLSKLEIDDSKDGDEYIYFNGKMVKRSVVLKMKKESDERKFD